jgi:preprotein translocase subunit SecA
MNKQRKAIYGWRRQLLEGQDQKARVMEIVENIVGSCVDQRCPENEHSETWDWVGLQSDILTQFGVKISIADLQQLERREMEAEIFDLLQKRYAEKESLVGPELMRETERMIILNVIDNQWKDHLLSMDHLKEGIGLRGYGQKDPLVEYKKESKGLFDTMIERVEDESTRFLFFLQRADENRMPYPDDGFDDDEGEQEAVAVASATSREAQNAVLDFTKNIQRKKDKELAEIQFVGGDGTAGNRPVLAQKKAGRNDPCPCGSGKKYKKCCGS